MWLDSEISRQDLTIWRVDLDVSVPFLFEKGMDTIAQAIRLELLKLEKQISKKANFIFNPPDFDLMLKELELIDLATLKYGEYLHTNDKVACAMAYQNLRKAVELFDGGDYPNSIGAISNAAFLIGMASAEFNRKFLKSFYAKQNQKKSNKKYDGNKEKAVNFWTDNSYDKGLKFKTKNQAANYMHDNMIVSASVKTIVDNYLIGIKKPLC